MRTTPVPAVDIGKLFPELMAQSLYTTRLHPRPGDVPEADGSKFGGHILWPTDEEWPFCKKHKTSFVPVLQLRASDVPLAAFPAGQDLLQVLWCPNDHKECDYAPLITTHLRRCTDIKQRLEQMPTPSHAEEYFLPTSCIFHPEPVREFPPIHELSDELKKKIESCPALVEAATALTWLIFSLHC